MMEKITYSHRALPNEFLMHWAPFSQGLGEHDTNPVNGKNVEFSTPFLLEENFKWFCFVIPSVFFTPITANKIKKRTARCQPITDMYFWELKRHLIIIFLVFFWDHDIITVDRSMFAFFVLNTSTLCSFFNSNSQTELWVWTGWRALACAAVGRSERSPRV